MPSPEIPDKTTLGILAHQFKQGDYYARSLVLVRSLAEAKRRCADLELRAAECEAETLAAKLAASTQLGQLELANRRAAQADEFVRTSVSGDISGFRSRILVAYSDDGSSFETGGCAIEGGGYDSEEIDAIHAEDMSLIEINPGRYRMYYACCDRYGNWRIASAVSETD